MGGSEEDLRPMIGHRNIGNLPATKGHWTHQGCWIKKKPSSNSCPIVTLIEVRGRNCLKVNTDKMEVRLLGGEEPEVIEDRKLLEIDLYLKNLVFVLGKSGTDGMNVVGEWWRTRGEFAYAIKSIVIVRNLRLEIVMTLQEAVFVPLLMYENQRRG